MRNSLWNTQYPVTGQPLPLQQGKNAGDGRLKMCLNNKIVIDWVYCKACGSKTRNFQKKGYGSYIMQCLEKEISLNNTLRRCFSL